MKTDVINYLAEKHPLPKQVIENLYDLVKKQYKPCVDFDIIEKCEIIIENALGRATNVVDEFWNYVAWTETFRERSCYTCNNMKTCFIFKGVRDATNEGSMNIDGDELKGKIRDIFEAVGECCFTYVKSKD